MNDKCPKCGGDGITMSAQEYGPNTTCSHCGGSGKLEDTFLVPTLRRQINILKSENKIIRDALIRVLCCTTRHVAKGKGDWWGWDSIKLDKVYSEIAEQCRNNKEVHCYCGCHMGSITMENK